MLIRKLRAGDCLTVAGVVIVVKKVTGDNLRIGIHAPGHQLIHHKREGESAPEEDIIA